MTGRLAILLLLAGCAHRAAPEAGLASWYGKELAGNPTASGEPFRPSKRTAAHRTHPFGTVLVVTRVDTGQSVRVVVNDRGPFVAGRVVDLARRAARRIDMLADGVTRVELRVVGCRAGYACQ
ncbi:MAG: rare lipoprotein A [Myxococcota bacterium]